MNTNNDCQNRREAIAALVLGELESSAADELKNHIDNCPDCRSFYQAMAEEEETILSAFKAIDDRGKAIGDKLVAEHGEVSIAHDDISEGQTESQEELLAVIRPNVWRTIMKSRITKLTTVAATILIAVFSMFLLDKSATPVYGITDLPGLFQQAKVIHIQGVQYFGAHKMPDGGEIPPVQIDNWIDLENGRSRYTATGLSVNKDNVKVTISEMISNGQHQLCLNHTDKNVTFFKTSDYQCMLNAFNLSRMIHGQIFGDVEQLQNFEKTTSEQINEVSYDIWQGEIISGISELTHRLKFWLSPETGKLGRFQMFSKGNDNEWYLNYDYNDIEYNIEIPNDVFSMEIPQDYMLMNTKETAIPIELGGGGGVGYSDAQYGLKANIMIGFVMPDHSVIAGWYSKDSRSETPWEEYFKDLEFGGSLPKLPVEIYGLKPVVKNNNITYTGYHLTFTQKADKVIEWSLYVPNGTPPVSIRQLGCNALYTFNLDPEPKWHLGLSVDCSLLIENADDFDTWILGAMAELSDDGKAPDNITYERVIRLAQMVR